MTELFPCFFEAYPNIGKLLDLIHPLPELLCICTLGLLSSFIFYSILTSFDKYSTQRAKEVEDSSNSNDNASSGFTTLNGEPIKEERVFYGPELPPI